ncbi:MAG TPA: sigma-70 family RNA polymerase sigma factor, partial [Minicystis sp.]|nr:sigma-70 family RNA polymerase sigma factor [Minicystis sp.]
MTAGTAPPSEPDDDADAALGLGASGGDDAADHELDAAAEDDAPERAGARRDLSTRPLNTSSLAASNREARRREAEEDRELIVLAQRGDQAAFRRLVERHQRRAFAIAVSLVRDENDARELVQEAFLRVYRGLDGFQGGSSFFTWLYRIVTNLAIDLMRKPGRKDAALDEAQLDDEPADLPLVARIDGADPVDVIRRREIAARIQAALDALPPYHRGV